MTGKQALKRRMIPLTHLLYVGQASRMDLIAACFGKQRKKVVYRNRYGLDIMGELYFKKGISLDQKYPALIAGAPYDGVKEQGPCVYGN